ncbi:MAG: hypothetical protein LBV30_00820 [Propionibacteriaceae bacterium]|nr:hypothetical protein [Propionibacteriaceae bacterium]
MVARSIAKSDPGYMSILASKVEIHEATVLPVAMRRKGQASLEQSDLELVLLDHVAAAYAIGRGQRVPPSLIPVIKEHQGQPPRRRIDDGTDVGELTPLDILINRTPKIHPPNIVL